MYFHLGFKFLNKLFKKLRFCSLSNSIVHRTSKVESGSSLDYVVMDRHSFCGYNCSIYYCNIGAFTSIANNVVIGSGEHPMNWIGMSPVFYKGRDSIKFKISKFERPIPATTIVGNDVWIGINSVIKSGVTIGDGAVVGMGSIVTKSIPPYEIWAGNPAKKIRNRFSSELIETALRLQWWSLKDEELKKLSPFVKDPALFYIKLEEYSDEL